MIVDPKVAASFTDTHLAQMLGYLNITGLDLALLLNFKNARLEWKRVLRPREAAEHDTPDLHALSLIRAIRLIRGFFLKIVASLAPKEVKDNDSEQIPLPSPFFLFFFARRRTRLAVASSTLATDSLCAQRNHRLDPTSSARRNPAGQQRNA